MSNKEISDIIEEDNRWIVDAVELEEERFDSDGFILVPLPFYSRIMSVQLVEGKLIVFHRWDLAAAKDEAEVHGFLKVISGQIMDGNKWSIQMYMGTFNYNGKLIHIYKARKEF